MTYLVSLDSVNTDARIPEYPDGENISNDVEFMQECMLILEFRSCQVPGTDN
jgi:hypothetical protein